MTKEQDKRIASEVLGWHYKEKHQWNGLYIYYEDNTGKCVYGAPFNPTTDANDDCLVLKHIRENWDYHSQALWKMALQELYAQKNKKIPYHLTELYYEPGDYSLSALKVLDENKKT